MAIPISQFQPSASLYNSYGGYGAPAGGLAQPAAARGGLGYGGASSFQPAVAGGQGALGGGNSLAGIAQALGQLVQQLGALVQALGGGKGGGGNGAQIGTGPAGGQNATVGTGPAGGQNATVGTGPAGRNATVGTGPAGQNATVGTGPAGQYAAAAGYGAQIGTGPAGGQNANIGTGPAGGYGANIGTGPAGGYSAGIGGAGAYGGAAGGGSSMPMPTDRNEYASYLQAATNGEGKQDGNLKQNRAMPNTRMGTVQDGGAFKAGAARDYAIQFAAEAIGQSGRSASGMAAGAQAFGQMSPDAQTFMQVASVYKGEGKNYDNGKLKELLKAHGVPEAAKKGVGDTDIETLGAVAAALNRGQISLKDITGTQGAVKDPGDYQKAIQKVTSGEFAREVQGYDATPIGQGGGTQLAQGEAKGGGAQVGNAQAKGGGAQVGNAQEGAAAGGAEGAAAGGDLASALQQIVQLLSQLLQSLQALLGGGGAAAGGGNEAQGGGAAQVGNSSQIGNSTGIGTGGQNATVGTGPAGGYGAQIGTGPAGQKATVGTGPVAQKAEVGNSTGVGSGY